METITIREVAKACGVGVSTVSRAINNHPNISDEKKALILRKIEELGYVPNNSARNLKRSGGKAIAVLVKGMTNPFFNVMIKIMEAEIIANGYTMVLQHVDPSEDEADVAIELAKEKKLCGIIFLGGIFARTGRSLNNIHIPYVISTVGSPIKGISKADYSSVSVDDEIEGEKVTSFLLARGRKRIAIFAGAHNDTSVGMLRLSGYKRALKNAGIEFDEELVLYLPDENEEYSYENGYAAAKRLLNKHIEFDAIFAVADVMAVGALRALNEEKINVPKEVAVIGFDGIELTGYTNPALSTLAQPIEEMAYETSSLLLNVLDGSGEHRHSVFEGRIIERETT
ncbi:MAG: LacI family transcriptional regulator [Lachnospiraceae bacterium]|nr:LacI family transcriptional regulator [Lachnospiraceae bacterium]